MAQGPRYGHFPHLTIPRTLLPKFQKMKWPYLGSMATNKKTKDIFFPVTFKVWESRVSFFFFNLWPRGRDIGLFSLDDGTYSSSWGSKERNGHISAPGPKIKKLRTLSFLQLLKFEKAKCPYFVHFWPGGQDICIFPTWRYSAKWWKIRCYERCRRKSKWVGIYQDLITYP